MRHVPLADAKPYLAAGHHHVAALRLQEGGADCEYFSVGLSYYLPGGQAEHSPSPVSRVYVVLEGELTVLTDSEEVTLGALDSCLIRPAEARTVVNRANRPATMLVIRAEQVPSAPPQSDQ